MSPGDTLPLSVHSHIYGLDLQLLKSNTQALSLSIGPNYVGYGYPAGTSTGGTAGASTGGAAAASASATASASANAGAGNGATYRKLRSAA
ncbi:unnamed protein product [Peronospora farinosa]|uniref:Uncharacterized protein n=1 Tax=Peronospora farinosa TaxID=134698 RepID=A0AAV0TUY4_9STRA|nr:unnamed protein product [Peronospora farinosa]